ncbi:MAG: GNAT family N-acetyltransferase, partial [Planctomycetota bacterium]
DDRLGKDRERPDDPLPQSYYKSFDAIDGDPNNELLLATSNDTIVGFLQLTFVPSMTYQGSWRALIEGVRVSREIRGGGIGRKLVQEAIDRAKARGCLWVQLTTNKSREKARRFYESLGFEATHEGMKLRLAPAN